ncbi:hypothetical protein [Sedimenticola hydrogenitrophicus]|uniref:hypothetical protein n=1 Tax=Sedimenticola hydrogenitrophicus TaxID=2967975 RepID=UPI0023B1873E|nr:hypothetical protein [Sedimenticola hydrogenitrophicus]
MLYRILMTVLIAATLAACAPTIGNKASLSEVSFTVGETHKSQVADTLGLPANMSRSEATGREFWGYREEAELMGITYAVPTGAGTVSTFQASTGEDGQYEFKDAAVVYVFDDQGILLDVRTPNKTVQAKQ